MHGKLHQGYDERNRQCIRVSSSSYLEGYVFSSHEVALSFVELQENASWGSLF